MASIKLTDTEWILLLDGQDEDSELGSCCANISALRDVFVQLVRSGRNSERQDWELRDLKQKIKWVSDGHELTPLLKKVCAQIGFDPAKVYHEPGASLAEVLFNRR